MTLPTFLGIGVPRAGTTWLYRLLESHPDVYVPAQRKEVHYFDRYYERGAEWYEGFFPPAPQSDRYQALGEFTPHYLYCAQCPQRIAGVSAITKLILMLRNPVDRAYSHYRLRMRIDNYSGSFEDFLRAYPNAIDWGFYSQNLKTYLYHFDEEQFLVLVYECAFADLEDTRSKVAHFLGVSPRLFPQAELDSKINPGYIPRLRFTYALTTRLARFFRERDLYWTIKLGRHLGVKRVFGEQDRSLPPMKEETRSYLNGLYREEIPELEALLGIDLSCWR